MTLSARVQHLCAAGMKWLFFFTNCVSHGCGVDILNLLNGEQGVGVNDGFIKFRTQRIRGGAFGAPEDARDARMSGRGPAGNAGACGNS